MHRRATAGAPPLQGLAAHRAEPSADRIGNRTIRLVEISPVKLVRKVRWTARVGTKTCARLVPDHLSCNFRRMDVFFKTYTELLRKPLDRFGGKLCSITLLEHRKSRLQTTNLGGDYMLGKLCSPSSSADFQADIWIEVFQRLRIMDFILSTFKGVFINIINRVINLSTP